MCEYMILMLIWSAVKFTYYTLDLKVASQASLIFCTTAGLEQSIESVTSWQWFELLPIEGSDSFD